MKTPCYNPPLRWFGSVVITCERRMSCLYSSKQQFCIERCLLSKSYLLCHIYLYNGRILHHLHALGQNKQTRCSYFIVHVHNSFKPYTAHQTSKKNLE